MAHSREGDIAGGVDDCELHSSAYFLNLLRFCESAQNIEHNLLTNIKIQNFEPFEVLVVIISVLGHSCELVRSVI